MHDQGSPRHSRVRGQSRGLDSLVGSVIFYEVMMSTQQKVKTVLEVMRALGGEVKDHGHCGARGRVISVLTQEPVQIGAVFYLEALTWTYKLEFSMKFSSASPQAIKLAAEFLAEQQAKVFPFLPGERSAVFDALQEHFGNPKKLED